MMWWSVWCSLAWSGLCRRLHDTGVLTCLGRTRRCQVLAMHRRWWQKTLLCAPVSTGCECTWPLLVSPPVYVYVYVHAVLQVHVLHIRRVTTRTWCREHCRVVPLRTRKRLPALAKGSLICRERHVTVLSGSLCLVFRC